MSSLSVFSSVVMHCKIKSRLGIVNEFIEKLFSMSLFLYQMVTEHPKCPLCIPCPAFATSLAMQASPVETAAEIIYMFLPVLCGRSKQTLCLQQGDVSTFGRRAGSMLKVFS